jgi:hypothetical protein
MVRYDSLEKGVNKMRTEEQKLATKLRKAAETKAHHNRVFIEHPPAVRYAKKNFKTGKKAGKKARKAVQLGVQ